MKIKEALKDIEEFVAKLEYNIDERAEITDNSARCIQCGKEKSEVEFMKLFFRKDQGICKKCWFSDPDE